MSKIDEILDKLVTDLGIYKDALVKNELDGIREAKAQLLELMLEVIGNAPIATRGTTQNPTNEKYWTKATTVMQKLIDEQLKRAYELFGKEQ